jgi:hypothetical protein
MVKPLIVKPTRRDLMKYARMFIFVLLVGAAFLAGKRNVWGQAIVNGRTYPPAPCVQELFANWSGSTNGTSATAALTLASTFGYQIGSWANVSNLVFSNGQTMALQNPTSLLCQTLASYQSSPLSLLETGTGSTQIAEASYQWNDATLTTLTASIWFYSDLIATDTSDVDIFRIGSTGADYVNIQFEGVTNRFFRIEGTGTISGSNISYTPSTWVNLQLQFNVTGSHQLAVYSTTGAQLGTMSITSAGNTNPTNVNVGRLSAQAMASGKHNYWGPLQIFYGSVTFPGVPQ